MGNPLAHREKTQRKKCLASSNVLQGHRSYLRQRLSVKINNDFSKRIQTDEALVAIPRCTPFLVVSKENSGKRRGTSNSASRHSLWPASQQPQLRLLLLVTHYLVAENGLRHLHHLHNRMPLLCNPHRRYRSAFLGTIFAPTLSRPSFVKGSSRKRANHGTAQKGTGLFCIRINSN